MKIKLIAVGNKMPAWVEDGVQEYRKRLPRDFTLDIIEVTPAQRTKNTGIQQAMEKEGQGILRLLEKDDYKDDYIVALEVTGTRLSTEDLAQQLDRQRNEGRNLTLLVGGADGLSPACLQAAHTQWSLSALTFPHPLVRVILAEQIYRAWSLLQGHPYHRS